MPRATYEDLIEEVRAQIAVDDDPGVRLAARSLARAQRRDGWLVIEDDARRRRPRRALLRPARGRRLGRGGARRRASRTSARRCTRWTRAGPGATGNTHGIYCDGLGQLPYRVQIHPPHGAAAVRPLRASTSPTTARASPPFPTDFDQALVDGAVAIGLARMDERFDSASYFDARFQDAIGRLRRRRHARVGRGARPRSGSVQ